MQRTISIFLIVVILFFSLFYITSFNNIEYSLSAIQMDTNTTESSDANASALYTWWFKVKANATESTDVKANATESTDVKANATESTDVKANATESTDVKANATESTDVKDLRTSSGEAPATNLKYCYKFQWGSRGKGDGQFLRPHDVVFDSKGYIYVNDREQNNIQKFSPDGKFISKFGTKGEQLGQFRSPYSMSIDLKDNLYVVDRANDRIQKISINGTPIAAWESIDGKVITNNEYTKDNKDNGKVTLEEFASPEDMAMDKAGNFYVTDTGNNRIIKFGKNFKYVSHFGQEGSGPGQFDHPHGIGIDSDGNIYINELNNARIQKFSNNGTFITQWGSNGTGPGQFTLPLEHLEVDFTDKVYMVDSAKNPRIQVFDTDGKFLTQFGKIGIGNAEFHKPEHVSVDKNGNIYVVDRGNHRIQVFSRCG
jgi:sugar lactone lactonase YvrE